MSPPANDRDNLLDFLAAVARPGQNLDGLHDDSDLVTSGLIDSLVVIEIILYLEREYGIDIHAADIDPGSLTTINGILQSIEQGQR